MVPVTLLPSMRASFYVSIKHQGQDKRTIFTLTVKFSIAIMVDYVALCMLHVLELQRPSSALMLRIDSIVTTHG